jgi:hypothetical protein
MPLLVPTATCGPSAACRLQDLGHEPGARKCEVVSKVLEAKWLESLKHGHNVGTYEAVKCWLAQRLLPQLLTENDASLGGRSPEAVLEEVLNLRSAMHTNFKEAGQSWSSYSR